MKAPAPSTGGYIDLVNQYMDKRGLRHLAQDSYLEGTALDTVTESNGVMTHKLNPKVFGQVLAPGSMSDFHRVFVGGWLCERPELWNGECSTASNGWSYSSTGHVDILVNPQYTKIGCAQYNGIVSCDLSY